MTLHERLHHHHDHPHAHGAGAKDPVCGMTVDLATAKHQAAFQGESFFFCCGGCREKFLADPARYIGEQPAPPPAPAGTIYVCPMHPEIRQVGPGSCSICGMALEPETPTDEPQPNAELADMSRRFWIGLAVAVPVVALAMEQHALGAHALAPQLANGAQLMLATPVVLWAGRPFFERAWA